MPLKVVIVGGGIAGFATAIGLATHGHDITVLERRRDESEDSGSAIQVQPNGVKIMRQWGMMEDLAKIAHDNGVAHVYDGLTGENFVSMEYGSRGGQWIGRRKDMRILFQRAALQRGAKLVFDQRVVRIEENERPVVFLESGRTISADLVIGADGTRSKVRRSLFPDFQPTVLHECCFQIRVPFSTMLSDLDMAPLAKELGAQLFAAPQRSTFSSVILNSETFDLQFIDHHYTLEQDPHPDVWTERLDDKDFITRRFSDHVIGFRKVIEAGQSAYKWRFVLIRDLPSWSSQSGRVILVGDACHAMPPYSGQGSAMCMEDAAVLAQVFEHATPDQDLSRFARTYEEVRRPRCETVQSLAQSNGKSLSIAEHGLQQQRNVMLKKMNQSIQASVRSDVKADGKAHFTTPAFAKWLDDWDAVAEVKAAMKKNGLLNPQAML